MDSDKRNDRSSIKAILRYVGLFSVMLSGITFMELLRIGQRSLLNCEEPSRPER
jgi:hypothetical protein